MESINTEVLILGAGLAGLSAAKRLQELGISDFLILEGQNRIGGRIRNIEFGGFEFSCGPMYIHGKSRNPLTKLVEKYGISLRHEFQQPLRVITDSGLDATDEFDEIMSKLFELETACVSEICEKKFRGEPIVDVTMREKLHQLGWYPKTVLEKTADRLCFDLTAGMTPEQSSSLISHYDTIANYGEDGNKFEDDHMIVDYEGYHLLLRKFAEDIFQMPGSRSKHLMLNQIVERIDWTGKNRVVVTTATNSDKSRSTSGRSMFTARQIIITFTPNVLTSGKVDFIPPLPQQKRNILNKLLCNNFIKVLVRFPDNCVPFWDDAPILIYANEAGALLFWINTAKAKMAPPHSRVLISLETGARADVIRLMPKSIQLQYVSDIFRQMYPQTFIPPIDIAIVSYTDDPFSLGAWSCSMGSFSEEEFDWIKKSVGPIHFAGDSASREYLGYAHGAFITGQNCADKVARLTASL